jgi:hypothetical protein
MAGIVPSRRVRGTPFTAGVQAAGAKAYTVYNHMLLASYFETYEADYRHLKGTCSGLGCGLSNVKSALRALMPCA